MSNVLQYKPYLIESFVKWCYANDFRPHVIGISKDVVGLPTSMAKQNEIILNIDAKAANDLLIDADGISFAARFSGTQTYLFIPIDSILSILEPAHQVGFTFQPGRDFFTLKNGGEHIGDEIMKVNDDSAVNGGNIPEKHRIAKNKAMKPTIKIAWRNPNVIEKSETVSRDHLKPVL